VAGRLTEAYGKPSIVLCHQHQSSDIIKKREYEKEVDSKNLTTQPSLLVASCRSPEWCHLVDLLDASKNFFVRYGGHRQAAGFTIEERKLSAFREHIVREFEKKYDRENLPQKTLHVECVLTPNNVSLDTLTIIDRFRPFGIGNMKPLFLLENLTIREVREIGTEKNHLSLSFSEMPHIK
jgi:single-stranded-DNA-specific exonuclease